MADDSVMRKADVLIKAATEAVADIFNVTPVAFRPVVLAAMRLCVKSAVATMSESDRALYAKAMSYIQITAVEIQRKP